VDSLTTARGGRLDEVSALLVDVCRQGGTPRRLSPGAEAELVAAARFHRVAPLVHAAHRDVAPHVADLFQADRLRAITGHLQACAALQRLGEVLGDTPWVTFKGAVFSEHAHPVPGIRSYNDVDVLVDPASLREVSRRLLAAGWRVVDYQDMLRNQSVPGEMHWASPSGALMDLHWSMVNMASRRRLFDVPTAELLQRRVPVRLGTESAWTLAPSDALVHACLHAGLAGANKLVYLVDVDRLSRSAVDWDEVASRSREWRAQAQVALVLERAHRVLGTPVPPDFASRARVSRSVRRLGVLADHVAPVARGRSNAGVGKFVARAARASGTATAGAFGRHASRGLLDRARGPRKERAGRLDADQASLEVYLAAVESVTASSQAPSSGRVTAGS
jgi:hypothetical protein